MSLSSLLRGVIASLVLAVVAGTLQVGPADAQTSARKTAEEALREGLRLQSKRDHQRAVDVLSRAVKSGALARKELALALYRRAISYRAQKQPARAISDLNSALFFKSDLSANDRAGAIELRMKAYQDAGLAAPAVATTTARAAAPAPVSAPTSGGPRIITAAPPRVSAPVRTVAPRVSRSNLPSTTPILGSSSATPAPSPRVTESAQRQIPAFATQTVRGSTAPVAASPFTTATIATPVKPAAPSWSTATRQVARTTSSAAAQAPAAPSSYRYGAPSTTAPTAWASTSRSATARPQDAPGDTARSVTPYAAAGSEPYRAPARHDRQPKPAANSGGGFLAGLFGGLSGGSSSVPETTGTAGAGTASAPRSTAPAPLRTAAVVPSAKPEMPKPRARGYAIEIAALHDRWRAEALAKQIMVEYSSDFMWSDRKTRVAERAGAEEGEKLYAVRLDGYADEAAARDFCKKLISGGYECGVIGE